MTLLAEIQNSQIKELKDRLTALEQQVTSLLELSAVAVINLRASSRERAKNEIAELFATRETLYYDDIMDQLHIDRDSVVDICRELLGERAIGGAWVIIAAQQLGYPMVVNQSDRHKLFAPPGCRLYFRGKQCPKNLSFMTRLTTLATRKQIVNRD